MAALRFSGFALLLLLSACAHRAYYVFGPDTSTPPDVVTVTKDACRLDFRGLTLGRSTVADMRKRYFEILEQPPCKEVKLRFHRPGSPLVGAQFSPDAADVIMQIVIDSDPERPRLTDAAVIRAVAVPVVKSPSCSGGGPPPCETKPPTDTSTSSLVYVETSIETFIERLVPVEIIGHEPVPPPLPPETVIKRETVEKRYFERIVGPAVLGGGIIYALAYFQMLPFAAAGALRPRSGATRPQWSLEDPEAPPPPLAAADPNAPGLLRDPRVRVHARGFIKGSQ